MNKFFKFFIYTIDEKIFDRTLENDLVTWF